MAQGITNAPAGDVTKKDLAQKAEKTHQHSTADITSGTLPIARDGTGQTTAAGIRNALGLGNTTGALPIANGGTGQTTAAGIRNTLGLGNTTGALPVANGGTGATDAATALSNLGGFSKSGGTISGDVKITGKVAEGYSTTASGQSAHAEGRLTEANGFFSHAEGYQTTASENSSHSEGNYTTASGSHSHAEGHNTTAKGDNSHAEGNNTIAEGNNSHAEGNNTVASGSCAHAEGNNTVASEQNSHSEGNYTTASGSCAHAEGYGTIASGHYSSAAGHTTTADGWYQTTVGCFSKEESDGRFVVGIGMYTSKENGFRVDTLGKTYGKGAHSNSGADYAEYFQWSDNNIKKEDRIGLFVTLDGEKIRLANPDDTYILGIVSGNPSVVGNACEDQWSDMRLTDIYGRPVMEEIEIPADTIEIPDPENPEQTITKVICEAHTEIRQKTNPDYDNTQKYVPRSKRPEWDIVGMLGQLVAIDDGTCKVNGWCTVGNGGIATNSEKRTKYRVMARLDKTHVKIMIL